MKTLQFKFSFYFAFVIFETIVHVSRGVKLNRFLIRMTIAAYHNSAPLKKINEDSNHFIIQSLTLKLAYIYTFMRSRLATVFILPGPFIQPP